MLAETVSKPGIGSNAPAALPLIELPPEPAQGRCPVDPKARVRGLQSILGIRLSGDLRSKLAALAAREGVSDSTVVRRLIADLVGDDALLDRAPGPRQVIRVPPEDLAAASRLLNDLTRLVAAARDLRDGQAAGATAALEIAHARLVRIIENAEAA